MKIDKSKLKMGIWYEDENNNFLEYMGDEVDKIPENAASRHVCFPLEINEHVYFKTKKSNFSKEHVTFFTHIGGDGSDVLAMANSGDYTLAEALAVYATACSRCMNALTYKYTNGKDGYPEDSDEYRNCTTRCVFCKEE